MVIDEKEYEAAKAWIAEGWSRFEKLGYLGPQHHQVQAAAGPDYTPCVARKYMHFWHHKPTGQIINSQNGKVLPKKNVIDLARKTGWQGLKQVEPVLTDDPVPLQVWEPTSDDEIRPVRERKRRK